LFELGNWGLSWKGLGELPPLSHMLKLFRSALKIAWETFWGFCDVIFGQQPIRSNTRISKSLISNPLWQSIPYTHAPTPPHYTPKRDLRLKFSRLEVLVFEINVFAPFMNQFCFFFPVCWRIRRRGDFGRKHREQDCRRGRERERGLERGKEWRWKHRLEKKWSLKKRPKEKDVIFIFLHKFIIYYLRPFYYAARSINSLIKIIFPGSKKKCSRSFFFFFFTKKVKTFRRRRLVCCVVLARSSKLVSPQKRKQSNFKKCYSARQRNHRQIWPISNKRRKKILIFWRLFSKLEKTDRQTERKKERKRAQDRSNEKLKLKKMNGNNI